MGWFGGCECECANASAQADAAKELECHVGCEPEPWAQVVAARAQAVSSTMSDAPAPVSDDVSVAQVAALCILQMARDTAALCEMAACDPPEGVCVATSSFRWLWEA